MGIKMGKRTQRVEETGHGDSRVRDFICITIAESWRHAETIVLFKGGCSKLPKNYRPIGVVSVVYKLFAMILLARMTSVLEQCQPEEQNGMRKNRGCNDHIHTLRLLAETAEEWGDTVWSASLDMEKAFDSISHGSVFQGLAWAGLGEGYCNFLKDLYARMTTCIAFTSDWKSTAVELQRGARQGDPLSPIIFITVLAFSLADLHKSWGRRKLGSIEGLSHMVFADDITLVAKSKGALKIMLAELTDKIAGVGLRLNTSKTKIQSNQFDVVFASESEEYWNSFEQVDGSTGFKVLGTMWTLQGGTAVEFEHRLRSAWKKFWQLWPMLGKRSANISKRFRLLDSAVGGTILWACQSWTLTVAQTRQLRTTQRRMQRKLIGGQKRQDEDWTVYIRKQTRKAEAEATRAGCKQWAKQFLTNKWHWAGHVARMDRQRWPKLLTFARTGREEMPTGSRLVRPRRGRPVKRWEDDMQQYCLNRNLGPWSSLALDRVRWKTHADLFANSILQGL